VRKSRRLLSPRLREKTFSSRKCSTGNFRTVLSRRIEAFFEVLSVFESVKIASSESSSFVLKYPAEFIYIYRTRFRFLFSIIYFDFILFLLFFREHFFSIISKTLFSLYLSLYLSVYLSINLSLSLALIIKDYIIYTKMMIKN